MHRRGLNNPPGRIEVIVEPHRKTAFEYPCHTANELCTAEDI